MSSTDSVIVTTYQVRTVTCITYLPPILESATESVLSVTALCRGIVGEWKICNLKTSIFLLGSMKPPDSRYMYFYSDSDVAIFLKTRTCVSTCTISCFRYHTVQVHILLESDKELIRYSNY